MKNSQLQKSGGHDDPRVRGLASCHGLGRQRVRKRAGVDVINMYIIVRLQRLSQILGKIPVKIGSLRLKVHFGRIYSYKFVKHYTYL
jgi:hypothetical protein